MTPSSRLVGKYPCDDPRDVVVEMKAPQLGCDDNVLEWKKKIESILNKWKLDHVDKISSVTM